MTTLKDKRWGDKTQSGYFKEEDVKEAILEFQEILKSEINFLELNKANYLDIATAKERLLLFKEIFGDFEK